jgi:Cu(I)-responsive transcriptional regulator
MKETAMNIGDVAERSGLPAKTIRYYEEIGLVRPLRSDNGYRAFRDSDLHKLTFLGRARALGFTIEDCRSLLALYEDETRESAMVKRIAEDHLSRIEEKIAALEAMRGTLAQLVSSCAGDDRPDCPILADLQQGGETETGSEGEAPAEAPRRGARAGARRDAHPRA